jgi:hypothetical protein
MGNCCDSSNSTWLEYRSLKKDNKLHSSFVMKKESNKWIKSQGLSNDLLGYLQEKEIDDLLSLELTFNDIDLREPIKFIYYKERKKVLEKNRSIIKSFTPRISSSDQVDIKKKGKLNSFQVRIQRYTTTSSVQK